MDTKHTTRRYRAISLIMILASCLVTISFYISTLGDVGKIYEDNTQSTIYNLKKSFLKDTVDNQINRIEEHRQQGIALAHSAIDHIGSHVDMLAQSAGEGFPAMVESLITNASYEGTVDLAIWDVSSGRILYDSAAVVSTDGYGGPTTADTIGRYAAYMHKELNGMGVFIGITMDEVDKLVKRDIAWEIHGSSFEEDSYIWINEVVDYAGGDNYAVRRVHPNLPDSEGMLLSTKMTDVAGNFPYLEELEGVKKYGEIFFTYWFKRKNSDEIAKKLTYARLYKPYDWIVAMGNHLNDMQAYIDSVNLESSATAGRRIVWLSLILAAIIASGYTAVIVIENRAAQKTRKIVEDAANIDPLTKSWNRRIGTHELTQQFQMFKVKGVSCVLISFDIDEFKKVNDLFGHDAGDQALAWTASIAQHVVAKRGRLYRWGGDEFLIICPGMDLWSGSQLAEQLRATVDSSHDDACNPTNDLKISLGATCFKDDDIDYTDALKRADIALYRAKTLGKNTVQTEP